MNAPVPRLNLTRSSLKKLSNVANTRSESSDETSSVCIVWERFHCACEELLDLDAQLKGIDTTMVGDW